MSLKKTPWYKLFFIVFCTLCFGLAFEGDVYCIKAEEISPSKKVVIILDVSQTMKENDKKMEAIDWVRDICSLCRDKDIKVSIETFSDQVSLEDGTGTTVLWSDNEIKADSFTEINESLDKIQYIGKKTDQLGALLWAEARFFPEASSNCTVVILSDGELDYLNRGLHDPIPFTVEEEKAVEAFKAKCEELGNNGCDVILIGFPNNVKMFKALEGKKGITYISQADNSSRVDMDAVLESIFKKLGYRITIKLGSVINGEMEFTLDRDYDTVIIQIRKDDKISISKESIRFRYNGKEKELSCKIDDLEDRFFIYLSGVQMGHYVLAVEDLNSDTESKVITQNVHNMFGLDVKLYDNQKNEVLMDDYGYFALNDKMMPLTLQVTAQQGMKTVDITKLSYYLDNEVLGHTFKKNEAGTIYSAEIDGLTKSGKYNFRIIGELEELNAELLVIINYEMSEVSLEKENISIRVREKVDLLNAKIKDAGYSEEQLKFEIDGEAAVLGVKTESYELNEDLTIVFSQLKDYEVKVYKKGELVREMRCSVVDEPLWKRYVWIIVCIAGVLVLGVVFNLIKRRED